MILVRLVAAAYWLLITVLLSVPDPSAIFFGARPARVAAGMRGMHCLSFTLLALLIQAARFPLQPRVLWGVLVGYALTMESLQWFVPHRTVELADYAENLLGLAVGGLLYATFNRSRRR